MDNQGDGKGNEQNKSPKKVKIQLEIDPNLLKEVEVLTTLGDYDSKEDFIIEAVTEKNSELMEKLKTVFTREKNKNK